MLSRLRWRAANTIKMCTTELLLTYVMPALNVLENNVEKRSRSSKGNTEQ